MIAFGPEVGLTLHPLCLYPRWDQDDRPFRKSDWTARFITLALKGDEDGIRRSYVLLGTPPRRFDINNYRELHRAFHHWAARKLRVLQIAHPVLVAVPNSDAVADSESFATKGLVEGIAAAYGAACIPFSGVRFTQAMPKARLGGTRDQRELLQNLVLLEPPPAGTLVLVDDVCTSGGHLFAVQRLLRPRECGQALLVGRTVHDPQERMLNPPAETIRTRW